MKNQKPIGITKRINKNNNTENKDAVYKKSRMIVRNLIFDVNENMLRKLFSKYGQVTDISLPMNPTTNKAKGFAFVQLQTKGEALKAIKELNGSLFKGRKIVCDMSVPKEMYAEEQSKNQNQEKQDESDESDEDISVQHSEKEDKTQKKQKTETKQKIKKPENLDQTVFIRSIPYDATEDELKEHMQSYGKVIMCKLVVDKETQENKGTGFVKFKDADINQKQFPQIAKRLIKASQEQDLTSLETFDVDLEFKNRKLVFLPALKKQEIEHIALEKEKDENHPKIDIKKAKSLEQMVKIDRQGKRNIKGALLGLFKPDDLQENDKNKQQIQSRLNHLREKIEKIKSPNMQVSRTRVAFKHLPRKNFGEKELKDFILKYSKTKENEQKLNKIKVIKQLQLLRDADNQNLMESKGIAFVEFHKEQFAKTFLNQIMQQRKQILKDMPRLPIIEYSIEDIRKNQKREKKIQNQKQRLKDMKANLKPEELKQQKKQKQSERSNTNNASKIQLNQIIEGERVSDYNTAKKLLDNIKSRGLRQRMKKRLQKKFNISQQDNEEKNTKREKSQNQNNQDDSQQEQQLQKIKRNKEKMERKQKQKIKQQAEKEELNQIKQEIKQNKKRKFKNVIDQTDDLDRYANKFLKSKIVKEKWYE